MARKRKKAEEVTNTVAEKRMAEKQATYELDCIAGKIDDFQVSFKNRVPPAFTTLTWIDEVDEEFLQKPIDRYRRILAKIDLSRFPAKLSFCATMSGQYVKLSVSLQVSELGTGMMIDLEDERIGLWHLTNKSDESLTVMVVHILRQLIMGLLSHELDECFKFEGRRIFDPHKLPKGK